ncbi:MAG: hypothetical protein HXY44_12395 [Syntrophaceae bacterium]|nr:hypothetical protein [Syntrophaceae bacterium]
MSKIEFYQKEVKTWFLDPKDSFMEKELQFELRKDFLTGHVSRILPFRRRKQSEHETPLEVLEASRKDCPFCPDKIFGLTPKFVSDFAPEGRIRRGKAVLFPNSFPYSRYNWVVVLSDEHVIPLDCISKEILRDGFLVAQEGIEKVRLKEPALQYCSINWNYFPQSGGGLFHPHIQVVIEGSPTSSHQKVLEGLRKYRKERGSFFWEDYLLEEIQIGKRYLGKQGKIHFLIAFSPRGVLGEIVVLFSERGLMSDLIMDDWEDLSQGLIKIFRFFKSQSIESFNLAIFSGNDEGVPSWVYARLCPRMYFPPWSTSDINYFEKLHDEVICGVTPEELCKELQPFFHENKDLI